MESTPALRNKQAKVLRKTWGLQGMFVACSKRRNIEVIPQWLMPQILPSGLYWESHCVRYLRERVPNGARASLLPLPITLIVPDCQSKSAVLILVNSISLKPDSVNYEIIALSRNDDALFISSSTCSFVRLAKIKKGRLGASTQVTGLFSGGNSKPARGL